MKTRVIQDDPDEPRPRSMRSCRLAARRPTNFAARMARWSAHHRKKAIFGWLAFAVVLFAVSFVSPMKRIVFETSGPGESGRADTILYDDFKQPAGEAVLIQSPSLQRRRSRVQGGGAGRGRRRSRRSTRSRRSSHRYDPETAARSPPTSTPRSSRSRSAGPPMRRPTRSIRSSRGRRGAEGEPRASTSARSARAPGRSSRARSTTTSRRPGSSRFR